MFGLYDQFDGTQGKVPLAVQRREHLEMWMLLGDPALRLPLLRPELNLQVDGLASPGKRITVRGVLPGRLAGATVRLALERPLSSRPTGIEKLPESSPENRGRREQMIAANHQRANDYILAAAEVTPSGPRFTCPLDVPATFSWTNAILRAIATTKTDSALGVLSLAVTPP
jgi:hypothetical protein